MDRDKDYIIKLSNEKNVKFIKLWFTDILGMLKSFTITIDELEDALCEGIRFDGATLGGFIRTNEHEMIALPDASTFQILPWRPNEDSVARMFCDIYTSDMKHYEEDSRYILRKTLKAASDAGFTFYTGPEIEFFFFKSTEKPELLDKGGYFDLTPLDLAADYRRMTVLTLEKMGINVISSHHEGAHSQHEIDLRHEDALTTADNIMTFRIVAKEIAQVNNIYASFMPKPLSYQNGSGMHLHLSLFDKDDNNAFFSTKDKNNLSDTAKHFIAGLLTYVPEFTAITNQWSNSYKRFVYGHEAPTHISWSNCLNSALIRIPEMRKEKPDSMRIELRNPDPSCNPYLVFSAILAAGMDGINNKLELEPALEDLQNNSKLADPAKLGCKKLPSHLSEALLNLQKSDFMKKTLGTKVIEKFIENKVLEIAEQNSYVTDYDIMKYYPLL
ncbi:MAG: glutamine synthetase [Spirochaetes bacterium]|nr:glutamine synthetase [Spirochaetota bacterium]MBN2770278.1 glutamine synthetase [Spirochaetota bacterium]